MKINMIRKMTLNKYQFKFDNTYVGLANFTFGILFKKIILYNSKDIYIIGKQHDYSKKLISIFPILNPKTSMYIRDKCPFILYDAFSNILGEISYINRYYFKLIFKNEEYKIQLHRNNIAAITKDNIEIARIEKDYIHTFYKTKYSITFKNEKNLELILFISIFADLILFDMGPNLIWIGTKTVLIDNSES